MSFPRSGELIARRSQVASRCGGCATGDGFGQVVAKSNGRTRAPALSRGVAEGDGRMSARSTPYPPSRYAVRVGELIWDGALATVRAYATLGAERGQRGSEALVYLGGVVRGGGRIVPGLPRPPPEP